MSKCGRITGVVLALLLLVPLASCKLTAKPGSTTAATSASLSVTAAVPVEYRDLYSALKKDLDRFDSYLKSRDTGARYPVVFGAELLPANSNRGPELVKAGTLQGTLLYLDQLQQMGIQGVTINVAYPVYTPDFPQYQDYVKYFKQVAQEVHRRGMKLDVETGVVFHDTDYSPIKVDFSGLTLDEFGNDMHMMVQSIINDLQPDYVNLGAEPDTHASLLGIRELNSPQVYTQFVNSVLTGLDRGTTKIAAGIGTWSNTSFIENLAKNTAIDCIAIHIYPVMGDFLSKAATIAEIAAQYNKIVILDECWLYKTESPPGNIAGTTQVYRLDSFSFWAPLDEQFLAGVAKLCRMYHIEYVSPFWANFFFGSLDYGPESANQTYTETITLANKIAVQNILDGKLSALGEYYSRLISDNR